ncbi:hypothetical protein Taro_042280 [Colocasia esculenta]|uniref:Uncharacterized protein n=1 Tax=Colocasia esculenta TaxID=4460 RepID=A0A843WI07_COLES|nr:hypothetical protein [Colocasia esculenta]
MAPGSLYKDLRSSSPGALIYFFAVRDSRGLLGSISLSSVNCSSAVRFEFYVQHFGRFEFCKEGRLVQILGNSAVGSLEKASILTCAMNFEQREGTVNNAARFIMWHRRRDYIISPYEDTVGIGRVEYMSWYWSITRRYIGRPGFTYDMRYEPHDHIERSLVEGMKHLHMMVTDGLQDDMISDSTQSRYIAMHMYIDSVLSQVQRTYSSTSDAGPSEPCAGTPQQPYDAGPPQFSPDVMTVSQYGLYDVGAS